jgi:hypothetical protein
MSYPPAGPPPLGGPSTAQSDATTPWPPPYPSIAPPAAQPAWTGGPVPYGYAPPAVQPRPAGVWQAILASAAVVLVVLAHFWEISRLSGLSALLEDAEAGNPVSVAEVRASDDAVRSSAVLLLAVMVIAAVFVMVWAYRARANAEAYTTSEFRRSRGWAIGGWICPIVSLWFPLQVMKDIWSASDTDRPEGFAIKAWAVTVVLPLWWTCFLGTSIVYRISSAFYNDATTASQVHTSLILDFASAAIDIAAAVMFIFIVATITRFQTQRYEHARGGWQASGQPA